MREYCDILENVIFKNGGTLELDGETYVFLNTCSVDYFLLCVYLKTSTSKIIDARLNCESLSNDLCRCFDKISNYLKNNQWDLARYEWATFIKMEPVKNDYDGSITFNFLKKLSFAFCDVMDYYQKYNFNYKCADSECNINGVEKTETSCKFFLT